MQFGPKNVFSNNPHMIDSIESPLDQMDSQKDFGQQPNPKITGNHSSIKGGLPYSLLRRFIHKLKENIVMKSLPSIQLSNFLSIIRDEAIFIKKEENEGDLKKLKLYCEDFMKKVIISPDHPCKMIWNVFCIFYLAFCFLYIPMEFSFNLKMSFNFLFDSMTVLIFLFDIILNFITGDFVKGFLVMDPKILCRNYLKGIFFFDFLAFGYTVMEIINHEDDLTNHYKSAFFYKLFILAKFPRFFIYTRVVLNNMKSIYKYQEFIDLIKLICYSLFLAHILACCWHLCSNVNPQKNWLIFYKIQDEGPTIKYIYSLYWTILTIMTVGYGDITPQNEFEALFAMFTIIFGCGLYAFNLNSIGIILQNNKKKENKFKNNLRIIQNFMDRKNIDIKLQRKVQEYLHFMWTEQQTNNNEEEIEIIKKLNETLQEELLLESYGGIFLNSLMFVQNFSEKSLRKIVKIIKEVKYIPGDDVFEVNF